LPDRIALLADIHGNSLAFEAVLRDLLPLGIERTVLMGDYFLFGPRPREVYERIREFDWPAIEGNTDRYIAAADAEHPFAELITFHRDQYGADALAWCAKLPFDHREDDLLVVHAAPTDIEGLMITEPGRWGTHPLTDAEQGAALMGDAVARRVVYGHIHYASSGTIRGQSVTSIGSVGLPFDGDHRAAYAVAHRDGDDWRIEHRRVEYDWKSVAYEVRDQGAPMSEARAQRLEQSQPVRLRPR